MLRLFSVADWAQASRLLPGEPVQWGIAVSADPPDPGTVTIAVSAANNLLVGTLWVSVGAVRTLNVGALGIGSSCT